MGAIGLTTDLPTAVAVRPALAAKPKAPKFYHPELDILRFVAFLSVFFCHGLPFHTPQSLHGAAGFLWQLLQAAREAGNFGVCLFFLLSSYLITELLRREYLQRNTVHLKAFYVRRSLRIWPLYFTVLLIAGAVGSFVPFFHMEVRQLIAYILFVGNWYILANPAGPSALGWLWSISVEEQFYIVWPTIAKLGGVASIAIVSLACIPLSLIAIAIAIVTTYQRHLEVTVWLNSVVQFQFFALGALLAICLSGKIPSFSRSARVTIFMAGAVCWVTASGGCLIKDPLARHTLSSMIIGYELVAVGCVCVFLSLLGASVKGIPAYVAYLGKISYGLYVFHGIALAGTSFARKYFEHFGSNHSAVGLSLFVADRIVALALTIALAALSYKYLESPWLRLKSRFTFVESRAV
jgi:peptidoglycan/LPS O-acetylase OafA/YrhL